MNRTLTQTRLSRPGRLIRLTLLVSLILFLAAVVLVSANQFRNKTPYDQPDVEAAIEDLYGIRITMVAITAGGGVIDFRFQVVDPEKADFYMHGPYEELPVLIVEKNGTRIDPRPHTHHVGYQFGRTYYTIYRNPGGIVEGGTSITAVLGDLRLEHIIVRE